ncbi:MCE family protein [Amycolatopsis cihanbeyliensis]|uniref:Phospholipid/cholesterol/gamma-HCH transport system substrate-binding protein n=1 Tax=Amycolatopsis cihanbeyliensis TaxID=1128664 RepID=A0A542CSC4_AMYCI|nr:MCE family protein [Amycolatopsis cihanbeyliensis]TQI93721.1 phospholipid/cholesterol/gamma-HCH transport system substrate-binding protein [Amycolatopsis cihanbeyliensis]
MTRSPARLLSVACVLALLAALGWYSFLRPRPALHLSADFAAADGIFPGSRVAVLGVPVGTVESVTPRGASVRIAMSLPAETSVPRDARAYIMNPAVVSDRFVELAPAHTTGPTLPDGAVIPLGRTHSPITFDRLTRSLDELLTALGPDGANSDGGLGELLHGTARALEGNGGRLRDAIAAVTQATDVLAGGTGDLGAVLDNVDKLTSALAEHKSTVDALARTVGTAATDFGAQQEQVAESIAALSSVLGRLDGLLREHGERLTGDLEGLAELSTTLVGRQRELAETLDTLPLALENFGRAVTEDGRLRIRLDISTNLSQFPTTAKLCARIPLPLCEGAGIVNPVPFPPELPEALGLDAALNGGG